MRPLAFGFFFGIGTDSHVMRVALALGMVTVPGNMKEATADLVEASLVPAEIYRLGTQITSRN
jgi:hypothetical protein